MTAGGGSRLSRYLDGLAGGLDGYPAAQAKGSLVRTLLDGQPIVAFLHLLPPALQRAATELPLDGEWVPETHVCALTHAVADAHGWSDEEVLRWVHQRNAAMYSSPLYRLLMMVASPEALLRHADRRWSNWHRGSALEFQGFSDDGARLTLTFPVGLWDLPMLLAYRGAFTAALALARAERSSVELEEHRAGFARYRARW